MIKGKLRIGIIATVIISAFMTACSKDEIEEPLPMESVNAETAEISDHIPKPYKTVLEAFNESGEDEIEEVEIPDWVPAYSDFLSDHQNLVSLLMEEGEGGVRGFITGFYLYDLNDDNIPELFVQKNMIADYIYTYVDGTVEMRNRIIYDAFGESYFGFDPESGNAYSFTLDVGTGTDRSTELSKLSLINSTDDTYDGIELLYSALYGDIETADGYDSIKWEDAIPSENNQIATEEFYNIAERFVPFDFHKITDENIEKYVVSDYMDIVEAYSVEAYAEKMQELNQEYYDKVHSGPVKDGKIAAPDNAIVVEDFIGKVYCDVDSLECYQESEMAPEFDEEWKNIYWKWVKDKEKFDGSSELWDGKEWSSFAFIDWSGHETPILYINTGSAASCYNFYEIIDKNVVKIATSEKTPIGAIKITLINDTDYYVASNLGGGGGLDFLDASLYRVNSNGAEAIWSIDWTYQYDDTSGVYYYDIPWDTSYENYDCTFLGQQLSAYEGLAKIDELFGNGAGEQIMEYVKHGYDKNNGPLSFNDDSSVIEMRTWDEWIYALDNF